MALKRAGYFRELRHGDAFGPSLESMRGALSEEERARIAQYLLGGAVLAATGTMVDDWFNPSAKCVVLLELRTDGVWIWPSDLAYYVEKYGAGVPSELLEHMARNAWVAPQLSQDAIRAAEETFFSDMLQG